MICLIDNYDSFTYNLADLIQRFEPNITLLRNDEFDIQTITNLNPKGIVISPGPGKPSDSSNCISLIHHFVGKIPILGICLGHQIIAEYCGASVIKAFIPKHGKTSVIQHNNEGIFQHLPLQFSVMRYHSLIIQNNPLNEFIITAWTDSQEIMAISKPKLKLDGIQFHPESILTEHGETLINNWLQTL